MHLPAADVRRRLRRALLLWFKRHRRDLPWRRDRDPYRIWVSEIMLQQTQVAIVVPYFERFLQAFPTLSALAAADEQAVLRLWEGLGYYRRARDLHRAARQVAAQWDGKLPDDPDAVSRLPGIGRYTLGAILSQAFDRPMPILEANSQRVLCRLLGWEVDPREPVARRRLWQAAETLLPQRAAGDFNQALMELGALVCTPATPRCAECPVARDCVANRLGRQDGIPLRSGKPEPVDVHESAVVVYRGERVLLVQRPTEGRWAGLWEFPHAELAPGEAHDSAAGRLVRELTGIDVEVGTELTTVRHGVTHHRITMVCFGAHRRAGRFRSAFYATGRWLRPAEIADYPVSAPQRRLARLLLSPSRQAHLF